MIIWWCLPWQQQRFLEQICCIATFRSLFCLWVWPREYKDMVSLLGANLHGGVISGRWCLKLFFGLILLMFLLSFCCRFAIVFVSRRFSKSVVRGTYLICSYKCWRRISSCILTQRSLESPCSIVSNMMLMLRYILYSKLMVVVVFSSLSFYGEWAVSSKNGDLLG